MVLEKKTLTVPLAQGLDLKSDPKQAPIGKLAVCENADFTATGKIRKRKGYPRQSIVSIYDQGAATIDYQRYFANLDDSLISYAKIEGGAYDSMNSWKWWAYDTNSYRYREVGDIGPLMHSLRAYGKSRYVVTCVSMARALGYVAVLACGNDGVTPFTKFSIYDETTGSVLLDDQAVLDSAGSAITCSIGKVFAVDSHFLVVTCSGADLWLNVFSDTDYTPTLGIVVASDVFVGSSGAPIWNACVKYDPGALRSHVHIAYAKDVAGVGQLACSAYDNTGTLKGTFLDATASIDDAPGGIEIFGYRFNQDVYVPFYELSSTTVRYVTLTMTHAGGYVSKCAVRDVALMSAGVEACYGFAGLAISTTKAYLYIEVLVTSPALGTAVAPEVQLYELEQNAASSQKEVFPHLRLASRPFQIEQYQSVKAEYDNRTYCVMRYYSAIQSAYFLMSDRLAWNGWSGSPVAHGITNNACTNAVLLPGQAVNLAWDYNKLPDVIFDGEWGSHTYNYYVGLIRQSQAQSIGLNEYLTEPVVVKFRHCLSVPYTPDESPIVYSRLGPTLQMSGPLTCDYDGVAVSELGFLVAPETPLYYRELDTGGLLVTAKTYRYRIVYEWTDHKGQVHRSAPSGTVARTVAAAGADNKIELFVRTLTVGAFDKLQDVKIVPYRTIADATGPFYRLPSSVSANNTQTLSWTTISDGTADAVILGSPTLYTGENDEILENEPPPSAWFVAAYKDRLAVINADDRKNLHMSKRRSLGQGTAFSTDFVRRIEEGEGDLIGACQMDDNFILFKTTSIWRIWGDGPDDTGLIGDWSSPVMVSADIGCRDKASIVLGAAGIYFMSNKGIYLLDRSLSLSYVGAEVESYNSWTIYRALFDRELHRLIFLAYPGSPQAEGQFLIYDYLGGQWSTEYFGASSDYYAIDACIWRKKLAWGRSYDYLYRQSDSVYYDHSASDYRMKIATTHLHLAGISGYQCVWSIFIHGTYVSNHTLNVLLYYDDESTVSETLTFTVTAAPFKWQITPARQYCNSIKIEIYDSAAASNFAAFELSAITLEVGVQPGHMQLRESRRK